MKKALLFFLLSFAAGISYAVTYTAITNGNFEAASTWSPAGGPPGAGDNVIIPSGITVTVTANNTAQLSGLNLFGTLTFAVGAKLGFSALAIIQVNAGGVINGGNPGSQIVFPAATYSGPFNSFGPVYYTNNGAAGGTLAVTVSAFAFEMINEGVKLSWKAENETDIAVYEIQWSATGLNNWLTIFTQKAANLNTIENYCFIQQNSSPGINYYRLKIVEKSGRYSYSAIVKANVPGNRKFEVSPSVTTGTLTCYMASSTPGSIRITDISGKIVRKVENIGSAKYTLQLYDIPPGIYFISLIQNNSITTAKFIKN
ncbi:T9SS type A sorting domain-containing protein [Ferruginibacter profundus]